MVHLSITVHDSVYSTRGKQPKQDEMPHWKARGSIEILNIHPFQCHDARLKGHALALLGQ